MFRNKWDDPPGTTAAAPLHPPEPPEPQRADASSLPRIASRRRRRAATPNLQRSASADSQPLEMTRLAPRGTLLILGGGEGEGISGGQEFMHGM